MSYLAHVKEAIAGLKERSGSSRQAIAKAVEAKVGKKYAKHLLNAALKKGKFSELGRTNPLLLLLFHSFSFIAIM